MAVDTRDKRMAMIGLGSPVPRVLPNPDGSFNSADDRYMLLFLYPIFGVVPPVPPTPTAEGASGGIPIDFSLPRRRWIDREDEELLFIILDD